MYFSCVWTSFYVHGFNVAWHCCWLMNLDNMGWVLSYIDFAKCESITCENPWGHGKYSFPWCIELIVVSCPLASLTGMRIPWRKIYLVYHSGLLVWTVKPNLISLWPGHPDWCWFVWTNATLPDCLNYHLQSLWTNVIMLMCVCVTALSGI